MELVWKGLFPPIWPPSGIKSRRQRGQPVAYRAAASLRRRLARRRAREGPEADVPQAEADVTWREVRGIFEVGYYDYDSTMVVTSLRNAQDMNDLGNSVQGLSVMLHDPFAAGQVRQQLGKNLGKDFSISTWLEDNQILSAVAVEKNVMFIILFCIMIVAALCILSALITFVVQKTREIGMLKALGALARRYGCERNHSPSNTPGSTRPRHPRIRRAGRTPSILAAGTSC